MAISDALVGNLMAIYMCAIAAIKVYALVTGRSFTGLFVLAASTTLVGAALIGALTWDLSRKTTALPLSGHQTREICRGGICWHGVAIKTPASQLRFRLPRHQAM